MTRSSTSRISSIFYDGGGSTSPSCPSPEVDPSGNVNVSRFGSKIVGIGASSTSARMPSAWCSAARSRQAISRFRPATEGCRSNRKGVTGNSSIASSRFATNAEFAEREGRTAIFVTERAVFRAVAGSLELIEIAPGIDIDRDIIAAMAFRPCVAENLKHMDARLFRPEPMGLLADIKAMQGSASTARRRRGAAGRGVLL